MTAARLKCCGLEDRTVVAYSLRKTKKIICGMVGESVVAFGRLPSPAHSVRIFFFVLMHVQRTQCRLSMSHGSR